MLRNNSKSVLEYIWIDAYGGLRSKTKVLNNNFAGSLDKIPEWNYDGSSTGQADGNSNTEVILKPCFICVDPLRNIDNYSSYLVLCDTYDINGHPLPSNHRYNAKHIFEQKLEEEPWFGLEQEYFFIGISNNYSISDGFHYCGSSVINLERKIVEEHLSMCLKAGINISGINAEVVEKQWEFQVGPCVGIDAGDQLIVARYILERVAEKYNVSINYNPKPSSETNGSGCHTNFSTVKTREIFGVEEIRSCMAKLERKHKEHISVYGQDNHLRLTGIHETASIEKFTYGIGTRNTSVRIPNQVIKDGFGYFEDRRPAANIDPYQVTSIIFKTCCLDE